MPDSIPLFRIQWGREEIQNVVDSITRGGYWAKGPYVDEFERTLEEYHDVDNALVFNSGTTALVSALEAFDIGPGDEVIVPSFTFIATANAVKLVGAEPRFADIEETRFGLDPTDVEDKVNDDTEAIIPVHYGGAPAKIHELQNIAETNDIVIIEDAAEAQGATANGEMVGTIGDAGVLSFCQNKIITTGEGGAVLTDSEELATKLELFRSHGRASGDYFNSVSSGDYIRLGSNYRMADINAALGVAQMEKIDDFIDKRRAIANDFSEAFQQIKVIQPPADGDGFEHVYQMYTIRFDESINRGKIVESLEEEGIASKIYFDPVHSSEYYQTEEGNVEHSLPVTEHVSSNVLSLPIFPELSYTEMRRIKAALSENTEI